MLDRNILQKFYIKQGKSMKDIANLLSCSTHQVKYWMDKYNIQTRSISEAVYLKNNPNGDPFKFKEPKNLKDAELLGLGLGLYWGEGTKADKNSVRLGNTDPELINQFINFLVRIFGIKKKDLKFSLQIFSDMNKDKALDFWQKKLKIKSSQFYKTTITKSRSIGTYRKKSQYGVLIVYYHNKKFRDLVNEMVARVAQW